MTRLYVVRFAAVLIATSLSFYLLEQPVLQLTQRFRALS